MLLSAKASHQRRVAVVMTDVVGSSKAWSADPKGTMKLLEKLATEVNLLTQERRGSVVKMIGDAFMCVFLEPMQAVRFAMDLQTHLVPTISHDISKLQMRVGVCYGTVMTRTWCPGHPEHGACKCGTEDLFGNTVNSASRLESLLSPKGGVALSVPHLEDVLAMIEREYTPFLKRISEVSIGSDSHKKPSNLEKGLRRSQRLIPFSSQVITAKFLRGVKTPMRCLLLELRP